MKIFIVGAGEVGRHVAASLVREGHDLVVVDRCPETIAQLRRSLDALAVCGDGCDPEILREYGIEQADRLFAVTDDDAANVLSALTARSMGAARAVVRVRQRFHRHNPLLKDDPNAESIHPEKLFAEEMLGLTRVAGASRVRFFENERLALLRIRPPSRAVHLYSEPCSQLPWPEGWVLAGVQHTTHTRIPDPDTLLEPGEQLYLVGRTDRIPQLLGFLGLEALPTRRVVVAGAGQVGRALADLLVQSGIEVCVIDKVHQKAFELAASIPGAVVLEGDATDPGILREAEVHTADYFVATTQDDMTNILSSLLARELNTGTVVALYSRPEFHSIMRAARIDLALSPRIMVAGTILRSVHRREILSLDLLGAGDVEVVEFEVPAGARAFKKPLNKLGLTGSVVAAVVRGDEIHVPDRGFRFAIGDHVLVFTRSERLSELERLFRAR